MFAEGETELRDLIVQNLETCGFLSKVKSELRAGVFLALSEEGSLREKVPLFNKKFDNFVSTADGKLALSVVREFLEYFNLNFTLSVFDPETESNSSLMQRSDLCKQFELNEEELSGPIVNELLKRKNLEDATFSRQLDIISEKATTESSGDDRVKESGRASGKSSKLTEENFEIKYFQKTHVENKTAEKTIIDEMLHFGETRGDIDSPAFDKSVQNIKLKEKNFPSNVDSFFDEPVPSEKSDFLNLYDGYLGQNKPASILPSDKSELSSLRDLPSLTVNKESVPRLNTVGSDTFKKDDVESNEEYSERLANSDDSIEEDIEEEFSVGLDDLLHSSSLGDDVTSEQTVSQASVVEGVDHIELVD